MPPIDPLITVEVLAATPKPQTVIYAALHTDYSEDFIWEERDRFPTETKAGEIAVKRLLAGGRGHYGPLEHPQITFAVGYFPHCVMQQARTHRIASFDVQCLSGDAVVTFQNCDGETSPKLKKTMAELYDLWTNGEKAVRTRAVKGRNGEPAGEYRRDCKRRIRKMRVRSLDEASNTFTSNHIEDVVFSGLNPVYRVTLADGKQLECTQNHRILTPYGWRVLAQLSVGSQVMVNGVPLKNADKTYQNKDWLQAQFSKGLIPKEVAALAGCSAEAVKKWAYHHGLTWTHRHWNKGLRYSIDISPSDRDRRRQHARQLNQFRFEAGLVLSGEKHPSWKPDIPTEKRVYHWLKYHRQEIIAQKGGACTDCGATQKLHVHHIQPVRERPDLAYDADNMTLLCATCHTRHHKSGRKNPLCAHPVEIVSIEYAGVKATYDLTMKAPHHNFVADGVVVHNSARYSGQRFVDFHRTYKDQNKALRLQKLEELVYLRPVGTYKDRQGKSYEYTEELRNEDKELALQLATHYARRLGKGFSEEQSRGVLPFDFRQHFVVSFNLRSLMHFLSVRSKADAQLEIRWLCNLMEPHFAEWCPEIYQWWAEQWKTKGRLAP